MHSYLKLSPEELTKEIQLIAAIKLYEMKKLSSGAAAEFANISKPVFLSKLADYKINTFSLSEEELIMDLKNA